MSGDGRSVRRWRDLAVGDEVRVTGPTGPTGLDPFVVVELHVADALVSDRADVVAVVRDAEGNLHTMIATRLAKL